MKIRALLSVLAVGLFATALALPILADTGDTTPPKRIWICHFPGHEMPNPADNFTTEGETVTGDYVMNAPAGVDGNPSDAQHDFCESRGGHLIELSERGAVNGHDVALQGRIATQY